MIDQETESGSGTESSLHDDLSAAYDQVTAAEAAQSEASVSTDSEHPSKEPSSKTTSYLSRDEKGKFSPKPKADTAQPNGAAKPDPAVGKGAAASRATSQSPDGVAAPTPEAAQPALKAPQSWKPAAREKWASLPPEVQHEAIRREREAESAMRETAEARRVHAQFREITEPYRALIESEGSDPMTAVKALLQGSAALRIGSQAQKAQYIAGLVKKFDVDIAALDSMLAGQPMRQEAHAQQFRDPRVDEMIARAKQEQTQRDQRMVREATTNIEKFAADHEFFSDVLPDFEMIYETMGRRNPDIEPDFQQVYDMAVAMNPDLAAIMAQRKAASSAATSQEATQRARQAASSVRSRPTVPVNGADTRTRDLRGDIEAAMEEVAAR